MNRKLRALLVRTSKILSRSRLYEFLAEQFDLIPDNSRILSVGSGGPVNALLEKQTVRRGVTIVQFDVDSDRVPDILGDICTHAFDPDEFDAVVMCEVLEHLHSPHLALDNIRMALRPGGRLILSTPFALPIHEAPNDYYRYTRYGLAFLLRDFSEVVITARNSYFEAIDVLWLRLIQSENRGAQWLMLIVMPWIVIKWPLTKLLGRLISSDELTTGYVVTARK
jgi:SAM-dependent methyltransferase